MARPVRMPMQALQQLSDWPIMRNRIRHGHDALKPKQAGLVARQHRPTVWLCAAGILHVVHALAVRLPHVDRAPRDRRALRVLERAQHEARLAVGVGVDQRAVGLGVRVMRVERPEHCALGAGRRLGMVDAVHQQRQPEHV